MTYCPDCTNKQRHRNESLELMRKQAKAESNEQKEAIAICEEITTGELFTVPALHAIANHCAIREIIHELQ